MTSYLSRAKCLSHTVGSTLLKHGKTVRTRQCNFEQLSIIRLIMPFLFDHQARRNNLNYIRVNRRGALEGAFTITYVGNQEEFHSESNIRKVYREFLLTIRRFNSRSRTFDPRDGVISIEYDSEEWTHTREIRLENEGLTEFIEEFTQIPFLRQFTLHFFVHPF